MRLGLATLAALALWLCPGPARGAEPNGFEVLALDSAPSWVVTHTIHDYSVGQKILFNGVAGHVPHWRDYMAVFPAGAGARIDWCYLDGSKTQVQARALLTGACTFEGLKAGEYSARVYAAGGGVVLASRLFTVPNLTLEVRAVPQDGDVSIERSSVGAGLDRALVKRSSDKGVTILELDPGWTLKRVVVGAGGVATATVIGATKAAAPAAARSVKAP